MERRKFMASLIFAALAAPRAAVAQQTSTARIGWLAPESRPEVLNSFRQTLEELGWVEGGNLAIEQRYAHWNTDRFPELVAGLVQLKVDLLVTDGSPATKAAQQATTSIPVVFVTGDPMAQGFVGSLARPGGNLTGVSIITADLDAKRIDLLKQVVPGLARLAILEDHSTPRRPARQQAIQAAARQMGIQLTPTRGVRKVDDLDGAFALAVKDRAGGALVMSSAFLSAHARRIASLAAKTRLPAIYEHQGFVEAGGLMSYGTSPRDTFRRVAGYVNRILRGAKPADLPVEQPTKLDLAINLMAAKTLGLTIPQSLLLQVDQVIQ